MSATFTIAHADLGPPRIIVRKTLDDAKKQAGDAAQAPKQAVDDAKNHAKNAVDDALDGGLVTDAGSDAGRNDGGDAGDGADGGDDPIIARDADLDRTRSDRAAHSRDHVRRDLARLGVTGPIDDALRDELRDHAKRIAWLDRIGAFADQDKDSDSLSLVKKLLEDESARHDHAVKSWVSGKNH